MDATPKRPWFRFRLSTVLILTAIAAWTMAMQPFIGLHLRRGATGTDFTIGRTPDYLDLPRYLAIQISTWTTRYTYGKMILFIGPFPAIVSPALALAAFLAWKAAWAVAERRRRQPAALK